MDLRELQGLSRVLKENIEKVIKGKSEQLDKVIIALLCEGHILLEDIPGTGKTTLAKALAKSIGCHFKRVQFTPDLLPTDLTGIHLYDQKAGDFVFKAGPIFTQILLADEINRATPRTQSSLLECMEEVQVTIDGTTYPLEKPFLVIATQNPIETQGTFPLPEAQLDRFFIRMSMGYPDLQDEMAVLSGQIQSSPIDTLESVVTQEDLRDMQKFIRTIQVGESMKEYIVRLTSATRKESRFKLGVSMRGSLATMKAAQAHAALAGRDYVIPDDVKAVACDVMRHRIIYKGYQVTSSEDEITKILNEIIDRTAIPIES